MDDAFAGPPEHPFLRAVRLTLAEFVRRQPTGAPSDDAEVEFPSASVDENGQPRFTMQLPASLILNDLGAAHLFYLDVAGRGFEFSLRRFLDAHLRSDDVFLDVGAHWGVHSLTAATRWPGQVSVMAIEAHPDNDARLRDWVKRNRLEADVEVVSKAVGDRGGTARLQVSSSSMGHSVRTGGSTTSMTDSIIDVDLTTIDKLLEERPHLRWRRFILKLDVEGMELEALKGARRLLATEDIAAVIWEKAAFHEPKIQHERDKATLDLLSSLGLEHFRMEHEGRGGALLPLDDEEFQGNVFSLSPTIARMASYG